MRTSEVCSLAVLALASQLVSSPVQADEPPSVIVRAVDMTTNTGSPYPLVAGQIIKFEKQLDGGRIKIAVGPVGTVPADAVESAAAASARFTREIEARPNDAAPLEARGILLFLQGKHQEAIADLDRAIAIQPTSTAYVYRGFAWKRSGSKEKALADVDEAIRLNPKNALAWRVRGATYAGMADYAKALAGYDESIRLQPENTESLHHRVMLTSGCKDDTIRNGKQAVADATKACELSEWKDSLYLVGLAAAHAEAGDFDQAIKVLESAEKLTPGQTSRFESYLASYRAKKPLRLTWR